MAIRHLSTKVCDYLIRADNGQLSLVGTFQNIYITKKPFTLARLAVVVEFIGDDGDPFLVTLEGANLRTVLQSGVIIRPEVRRYEQWSAVVAGEIGPIEFSKEGVYQIVLRSSTKTVHRYHFGVLLNEQTSK